MREASFCAHLLFDGTADDLQEIIFVFSKIALNSKYKLSLLRTESPRDQSTTHFRDTIEGVGFMQVGIDEYCLVVHKFLLSRCPEDDQRKQSAALCRPQPFFRLCSDCGASFEMRPGEVAFYEFKGDRHTTGS